MSVTSRLTVRRIRAGRTEFREGALTWDAYLKISDALEDQPGLRLIYCDGRLSFVGKSRGHGWFAERLAELVKALARGSGFPGGWRRGNLSPRKRSWSTRVTRRFTSASTQS